MPAIMRTVARVLNLDMFGFDTSPTIASSVTISLHAVDVIVRFTNVRFTNSCLRLSIYSSQLPSAKHVQQKETENGQVMQSTTSSSGRRTNATMAFAALQDADPTFLSRVDFLTSTSH